MILLLDNYDSFTYNLYQLMARLGADVQVALNDAITVAEIRSLNPAAIVISPGPRTPEHAGICLEVIATLAENTPILGVCLGHQALGVAAGKGLKPARTLIHGQLTQISHDGSDLFRGLTENLAVACYHSLILSEVPRDYIATARDSTGELMAMQHRQLPLYGVQFHPESYLMESAGEIIIQNFLKVAGVQP